MTNVDDERPKRPPYVHVDGDVEVVDLVAAAKANRPGDGDPVFHALLRLLSREGSQLEDFGYVQGDPSTGAFRARVTVNGHAVSFVDLVTSLYAGWQESVEARARTIVEDLVGDRMRKVEDDLEAVRSYLRESFAEAWFRPRGEGEGRG